MNTSELNDNSTLTDSLQRLNLSGQPGSETEHSQDGGLATDTTQLPPSTPRRGADVRSPRRKSPSSTSVDQNVPSPTLRKKTSVASIRERESGGISPQRPSSRRSLSSSTTTTLASRTAQTSSADEQTGTSPKTAEGIASAYFAREMEQHRSSSVPSRSSATVIIHDSCYGHRYARPRTTKANLATIVERPERVRASVLGVSMAYVLLGGKHHEGQSPISGKQESMETRSMPFRIQKSFRTLPLTSPAVTNVHGANWMDELKVMCGAAADKLQLNGKELVRPENSAGGGNVKPKLHEGDLYLCSESLAALEGSLGAVCDGVDLVFGASALSLGSKRAFVCIRPPGHHCSASYPSGFCWLNNVHVGISHAAASHGLTHAAIIDFDLHHGDGSQSITWAHNAKVTRLPKNAPNSKRYPIGYFSVHDINSYPCEMGDEEKVQNASLCIENAHGQSIWNVHLQAWKTEAEFWELYETRYAVLIEKARNFLRTHTQRLKTSTTWPAPKAAIFISAGFDASEWEGVGMQRHKVNVPTDFYARITRDVTALADEEGLGVDGRVISVLEGGYSDRALTSGTLSHLSGLIGKEKQESDTRDANGLGYEMGRRFGSVEDQVKGDENLLAPIPSYDTTWWAPTRLEEIENAARPPTPALAPKKKRSATPPTYTTPTQSFTAKIVTPPKPYRSVSGAEMGGSPRSPSTSSRPPSPPPPEVRWATSAYELCKLLVPSDRSTRSFRADELAVETSKSKAQQLQAADLPGEAGGMNGSRMTLRDRKPRTPTYALSEEAEDVQPLRRVSRTDRRRTMAGMDILVEGQAQDRPGSSDSSQQINGRPRRRSSIASSVTSLGGESAFSISRDTHYPKQASTGPAAPAPSKPPTSAKNAGTSGTTTSRKPRANAPSRAESSRSRSVKSNASGVSSTTGPVPTSAPQRVDGPTSSPSQQSQQDVDSLTSGITRIKLNVPSKEGQAAREKKSATPVGSQPEKKAGTARAPRKPAVPKAARTPKSTAGTKTTRRTSVAGALPTSAEAKPPVERQPVSSNAGDGHQSPPRTTGFPSATEIPRSSVSSSQVPIEVGTHPTSSPTTSTNQPAQPVHDTVTFPMNPPPLPPPQSRQPAVEPSFSQFPALVSDYPQTSSRSETSTPTRRPTSSAGRAEPPPYPQSSPILPSTSSSRPSTPSRMAGVKRENLPRFTASSPIPFGSSAPPPQDKSVDTPASLSNDANERKGEDDVWNIPTTPKTEGG